MSVNEKTVLRAIRKFGPDCTANDVYDALNREFQTEPLFGLIFTVLDNLSRQELVIWKTGEANPRTGGRRPRLYTITPHGIEKSVAAPDLPTVSTEGGFALG